MIEVQDIFRQYGDEFLLTHTLSPVQKKAFRAIQNCRTQTLGAHIHTCNTCDFEKISYNSCRNRHCPKCQIFTKEQWVENQNQYLLNTVYFHVVFTLPEQLNAVMLQNQAIAYKLFFQAVSETLLELCADKNHLGAKPGITAVLHTWGQNLSFHPHIHCIVTGGGLTKEHTWKTTRKKFFLPVKVLSQKFRGKFLSFLKQAGLSFDSSLFKKEWVVYCKPPFQNASKVIAYLGRYTHRVAISNDRIVDVKNGRVTFSWRDYRAGGKKKLMTLCAIEFIRRFMLHILPHGFRKIRHYGILTARNKSERISLCRKLTKTTFIECASKATTMELLRNLYGENFNRCPHCGVGYLSRDPPSEATA